MESSLVDYTKLEELEPLGTTVGGWVDAFRESVNSWWGGNAPEVEMQPRTFSGQINELPPEEQPLLGGDEEEAEWGEDSELPGGEEELEELDPIMELEAPPPRVRFAAVHRKPTNGGRGTES